LGNNTNASNNADGSNRVGDGRNQDNPTVLNARMNEVTSSLANMILVLTITVPQIIAALCVLPTHWSTDHTCDDIHMNRWKWWAAFSAVRMTLYNVALVYLYIYRDWLQQHQSIYVKAMNFKNTVDAFGLVWFVVGNMWLFGDDDNSCPHPGHSPIYNLCLSMIIINYIQICLPCIIAILLIPVFCFCMPCLIRALARLQNARQNVSLKMKCLDTHRVFHWTFLTN
jgi:E3 ubiquitin-protein ligase RNF38/44